MKMTRVAKVAIATMALGWVGCSDRTTQTELAPEGPPEIKQVFMNARVTLEGGSQRTMNQLAYGSHPDINDDTSIDDLGITNGPVLAASARTNRIRVVFDELLVGNYMEEIACNDGSFSHVPWGADPDDIAKCSGTDDAALAGCTGPLAVCVTPDGPVGILDEDDDGAVDDMRLKANTVYIECDGSMVYVHQEQSFYQPAGNQLISAGPLGVNSLGPALIVVPANPSNDLLSGMRTGSTCTMTFDERRVFDKDEIRPCAPAEGDDCEPGNTAGIAWTVEALRLAGSNPLNNQMNVALGNPNSQVLLQFNAAIDDATLAGITVADEAGVIPDCGVAPCVNRSRSSADPTLITIQVVGGFTPSQVHTVTIPTSVTDVFGGAYPAETSYQFTVRAP
jgi:hypothetical protein